MYGSVSHGLGLRGKKGSGKMRGRLLSICLAVVLLMAVMPETARAAGTAPEAALQAVTQVDGAEIRMSEVDGDLYLFLPAAADLKKLPLQIEGAAGTVTLKGSKSSRALKETVNLPAQVRYS